MSIWYRTGGTLNFSWHVAWADDKAALVERLYTAGYPTIEAERQPTEYLPAGAREGKYANGFRRAAIQTEVDHG